MPHGSDEARPRSARGLLADPRFGPFFIGKVLSTLGIWIHNVAAAVLVHRLTGSTLLVGAVSVGQFLPQLVLAPWSGARADRHDRRRQVLLGVAISTTGSLGLASWAATSSVGPEGASPLIVAATVVGIGFALSGPAMQALVPLLVRPSELTTAIAMTSLPFTLARTVGPALGAVLITRAGPVAAFGTAGTLGALYLASLVGLRPRRPEREGDAERGLLAGWRFVRSEPRVRRALVAVLLIGVGADPVITLTPALAADLGAGGEFVGTLASAFGAGAALGFVLLGVVRQRLGLVRTAAFGLGLLAAGWLVVALVPVRTVVLLTLVVAGAGMTLALPTSTAIVQRATPDAVRGRVMAVWTIAFLGSRPLTASVTGAIADLASVRSALILTAVTIALGLFAIRQPSGEPPLGPARHRGAGAEGGPPSAATTSESVV